jgi:Ca2+-binding RTX toxin-like protein
MIGGDGADMVDFADSASFVRVDLAITEQDIGFSQGIDTIIDIESVTGSSLGDTLRGSAGANKLWGLGGNDTIEGRSGNDIIDGGLNYDTASYESASKGVSVQLGNALPQNTLGAGIDSLISIEALRGSAHNDILVGDLVGNRLYGGDGDDWLFGGEGDDWISGEDGNDLIFGGEGDDILSGGFDGIDIVSYLFATAGVTATLATTNVQNTGGAGLDRLYFFENLDGSQFNDNLTGTSYANVVNGFGGHDDITAGSGNDTVLGGAGSDTIDAGGGNDVVDGGLGLDNIDGGDGADTIDGGDGADLLKAGTGQDRLTGGDEADIFAYLALAESAADINLADVIADYAAGEDAISLSVIDADSNVGGHQSFTFIGGAQFSAAAQVRFQQSAAHDWTIVSLNVAGASDAEMRIKLDGLIDLTANDFLL